MGQYHYITNLDKQEFINPHTMAVGLKAWEQIANMPSTPQALFALLMCSNGRGGGDLKELEGSEEKIIGRWTGDRIAVVGDYAEDSDLSNIIDPASKIYRLCYEGAYRDITRLVRPIIEAELGIEYYRKTYKNDGGYYWRYRRDPKARFSILD